MTIEGVVREFDADRGWGVLDAAETPGGCWVHFSAIAAPGYRALTAGQRVFFRAEAPGQDGYPYRATKVWRDGPVEPPDRVPDGNPPEAYRSTMTIVYDDDPSVGVAEAG
ncbi:cold shock domain-containing protein [Plantactinospora veratri]|uniref:Cold shock domain-containing protein n=1 Tax=Plantactinospora veratri TaxID=1436122 RepID=A0ABU7SJL6_9ACTN